MIKIKLIVFIYCFLTINAFGQRYVVIDKAKYRLSVLENNDTLFQCTVALGKNLGNKEKIGDMKTPEGIFTICSIEKSSRWTHDFRDGKGIIKNAYGPYFFRLRVPNFKSIGIHGTCKPETIGTRDSEGCIRLRNEDIIQLKHYVKVGMSCIIEKDFIDNDSNI